MYSKIKKFYTCEPFFLLTPELISRAAILEFLEQHPITVIMKKDLYYCISGYRSLFIANKVLPTTENIKVCVKKPESSSPQFTAFTDLLLTSLILSPASPIERFITVRQEIINSDLKDNFGEIVTCKPKQLTTAIKDSKASIYKHIDKIKPHKE